MLVEIEVKKPVSIPGGEKSRVIDLRPGITQVDDSIFGHWFVKSLVKSGVISLVKRKVHIFKSLDQIAEEKKQKVAKEKENDNAPTFEKDPVIFASHSTMAPVGTVLDENPKGKEADAPPPTEPVKKVKKTTADSSKLVKRKKV